MPGLEIPRFEVPEHALQSYAKTQRLYDTADQTPDTAIYNMFAIDKHRNPDLAAATASRSLTGSALVHPGMGMLRSDLGGQSKAPPHTTYRQDLVSEAVRGIVRGSIHPEEIDPVHLQQTQSGVKREGVRHYVHNMDYWRGGKPFADQNQAGNRIPIIYERTHSQGHRERFILSGHHRAAAAVAMGVPLMAHVVQAP